MPPLIVPVEPQGLDRRDALRLFAAGAAALVSGCKPEAELLPYVDMPEGMVPGEPMLFATTLPLGGIGRGVLVESNQGRPTKIHGNPLHPGSLGGTDVFAEAELLSLFDPSRSTSPETSNRPLGWSSVASRLASAVAGGSADAPAGQGVALLTGPVASPTLARQIAELLSRAPGLAWYSHEPVVPALQIDPGDSDPVQIWPDFDALDIVVTIGADPLGPGPGQVAFAKGWARAKRTRRESFRAHAFEAVPTLTGAQADARTPVRLSEMPAIATALRAALDGGDGGDPRVAAAAAALGATGRAAVIGGPDLPPETHATIRAINDRIGAPLAYLRTATTWPDIRPSPMDDLLAAMEGGAVETLVILGANPVYDLGARFEAAMDQVPQNLHFGLYRDETARRATIHAPLHHPLEDWSDLRALDGTVSLVQPLIAPLHDSRSTHQVLAMMAGDHGARARDLVASTWRTRWDDAFEARWRTSLYDGVIRGTGGVVDGRAPAAVDPAPPRPADPPRSAEGNFELVVQPSHSVYDGAYAPNAWLQECPAPFTKEVWGNALTIAPEDAERLGLAEGDLVTVTAGEESAAAPIAPLPGQAPGTIGATLGYGRIAAGPIGTGIGVRVAGMGPRVELAVPGGRGRIVRTQHHFAEHHRHILRTVTAHDGHLEQHGSHEGHPPSFYPDWEYEGARWGMVIDTDTCIGCNACMIACQSENNIPVVGPEEVAMGRHMHWIRVDAYDVEGGTRGFQPVPCMQCEKAPCEPACPVAASVHDSEGLNGQVYNRCIGTRFCQANCPYQVRRFNFFDYADGQAYRTMGHDLLKALANPEVSVRGRGVMEKCTYCVQRISRARQHAKAEDREIADGDVVTACQSACPAEAITFGDLADPEAGVSRATQNSRHYALLEHVGTRPRTTYLAKVRPGDEA